MRENATCIGVQLLFRVSSFFYTQRREGNYRGSLRFDSHALIQ